MDLPDGHGSLGFTHSYHASATFGELIVDCHGKSTFDRPVSECAEPTDGHASAPPGDGSMR